jgi:hypothetical protein
MLRTAIAAGHPDHPGAFDQAAATFAGAGLTRYQSLIA